MNANPKFLAATAHVDEAAVHPLPNSRKVYVQGSRPDIQVPMREITQEDTPTMFGGEKNPPLYVYDCSGPYSDLAAKIDIRSGLAPVRGKWIEERNDTEVLAGPSSQYGIERLADAKLAELRFNLKRAPRRARAGMNVSQMHYARKGIVTPEMEYIAIRERPAARALRREPAQGGRQDRIQDDRALDEAASGRVLRRVYPRAHHARVRAQRSGARPRHHPGQHQPSGNRADDHRAQLPGEDQRQHRQFGRQPRASPRRSRK